MRDDLLSALQLAESTCRHDECNVVADLLAEAQRAIEGLAKEKDRLDCLIERLPHGTFEDREVYDRASWEAAIDEALKEPR